MHAWYLFSMLATRAVAATWPVQSFVTEDFHPPTLSVNKTGATADGFLFFTNEDPNAAAITPLIMTDDGDLIWQSESSVSAVEVFGNTNVQQMDGKTYLTFFDGLLSGINHAYGSVEVLDHTYTRAFRVCLQPPDPVVLTNTSFHPECFSDIHESQFTDRGTILVTLYNATRADLSPVGGPEDGWILDSQFYEVDIKTNEIKFVWKSLDNQDTLPINMTHYPLNSTGTSQESSFDYFHTNAISATPDGGYLVSSRHFWSVIKLTSTGAVEWVLEGNGHSNSFSKIDPALRFAWQHDVRISDATSTSMTISMMNNANSEFTASFQTPSSGLLLSVNTSNPSTRTATLLRNLVDPTDLIFSTAEGDYQDLPGGNVLLQYGIVPEFKEFQPDGKVAMSARFGNDNAGVAAYRGFRFPWVGTPSTPPKAKAVNGKLYMSWNGATNYDQWMVFEGTTGQNLKFATNVTRSGFESSTPLKTGTYGFALVKAVQNGVVQGQSAIVPVLKTTAVQLRPPKKIGLRLAQVP